MAFLSLLSHSSCSPPSPSVKPPEKPARTLNPSGGTMVSLLVLRYLFGRNRGAPPPWQTRQKREWLFSALCGRSVTFGRGVAPPFFPRHCFHTCSLATGDGGGTFAVNAPNYPLVKKQRDGERQPALPGNYGGAPHLFATNTTPIKGSQLILGGTMCVCVCVYIC